MKIESFFHSSTWWGDIFGLTMNGAGLSPVSGAKLAIRFGLLGPVIRSWVLVHGCVLGILVVLAAVSCLLGQSKE